eukprot:TRINITY_DN7102_c0_g1_i4.p1 TRINITY_DN7102_c0_g1~~TRINITY_DN7102_c0_g1_i4.p1  ORF type:complete len:344 (+),score=50.66 TRINITY_DN7102_c0_g1_i4:51-1034(+)
MISQRFHIPSFTRQSYVPKRADHRFNHIRMHAVEQEQNNNKQAVKAMLGLALSATVLISGGASQAAGYADEMFKIVQERSGSQFGKVLEEKLEKEEADVVSKREALFDKIRSEVTAQEKVVKSTPKKEVVQEARSKPTLEDVQELKSQLIEESQPELKPQTAPATTSSAPPPASKPTAAPKVQSAPEIKLPKVSSTTTTTTSSPSSEDGFEVQRDGQEMRKKIEDVSNSSMFANPDGTFKSTQQVYIAGAVAIAAVVGGVVYSNSQPDSQSEAATSTTTVGAASNGNPQSSLEEAEKWVANWKASIQPNSLEEAEKWVANWKASQKK